MKKLIFISLIVCFESVSALSRMNAPKKENCNTRVPSGQHYTNLVEKAVGNGEKIEAQEAGIRLSPDDPEGRPDQRKVCKEKWCQSTQKILCKDMNGKTRLKGSANVIGANNLLTVDHVMMNESCEAHTRKGRCYIKIKNIEYDIKFNESFSESNCRAEGFEKGKPLVLRTERSMKNVSSYNVISKEQLANENFDKIYVVGAYALNSEVKPSVDSPQLVSEGKAFKVDLNSNEITYDNDTGPGTSGGAIVGEVGGKKYLLGVHLGDNNQIGHDGDRSNSDSNYGIGVLFSK